MVIIQNPKVFFDIRVWKSKDIKNSFIIPR